MLKLREKRPDEFAKSQKKYTVSRLRNISLSLMSTAASRERCFV